MNKTLLKQILFMTQEQLITGLTNLFPNSIATDDYVLVPGEIPVLLVAHLDTVHRELVTPETLVINGNIWSSPVGIGGDDRCGVYGLINAHGYAKRKPWLLFTTDEEIGGVGVRKFLEDYPVPPIEFNFMIEFDRKGYREAVYYKTNSEQFERYMSHYGFNKHYGSYSDIYDLTVTWDIPSCNISVGYYKQHTRNEYIAVNELDEMINYVIHLLDNYKPVTFSDFTVGTVYSEVDDWAFDYKIQKLF